MNYALISPDEQVQYISGWTEDKPPQPIWTTIPNAERIAEVAANQFEVAPPLFWLQCDDQITAELWYYDAIDEQFKQIPPPVPRPTPSETPEQF